MEDFMVHHFDYSPYKGFFMMHKNGYAVAKFHIDSSAPNIGVLQDMYVSETHRSKGFGTIMQELREDYAKEMGCDKTALCVQKNSWMVDWYKRRGYYKFASDEKAPDLIWMVKHLNN